MTWIAENLYRHIPLQPHAAVQKRQKCRKKEETLEVVYSSRTTLSVTQDHRSSLAVEIGFKENRHVIVLVASRLLQSAVSINTPQVVVNL